jgi:predicted ATPase
MPLALELAAARTVTVPLDRIVRGLDDRFALLVGGYRTALPRQQTLVESVDWSYRLLEPDERVLFRRLGVFAGGFTADAAEIARSAHGGMIGRCLRRGQRVDWRLANWVVKAAMSAATCWGRSQTMR